MLQIIPNDITRPSTLLVSANAEVGPSGHTFTAPSSRSFAYFSSFFYTPHTFHKSLTFILMEINKNNTGEDKSEREAVTLTRYDVGLFTAVAIILFNGRNS